MTNRLAPVISCHAWNADGSKLALCPNNTEIHVFSHSNGNFTLDTVLTEHDQVVTGIDWAPTSNRIVSCSQDRNAYVWTETNGTWKPTLVILRINRAATHVKWSPSEDKFAVASGAKLVSICSFEEDNDWWVSKHLKKHKSTVTKVDWHPNNCFIATGSTDFKVRIFPVYIKGVDKKVPDNPWGPKLVFGESVAEIDTNGWVQSVKWSPDGSKLAFCTQDSTVSVADTTKAVPDVVIVKYSDLPLRDFLWLNEDNIVGGGYDCTPLLFQNSGSWQFVRKVDTGEGGEKSAKGNTAMNMFKNKVDKGENASEKLETKLNTKHQNAITCIQSFRKSGSDVTHYSTSGLDGALLIWDAKS